MCEAAPGIIDLLDRMGVPFNRTPEGLLDFRRFGGTLYNRTAFAGATTGQQLLYALDEQVRRYESEGKVKKYEHWEFLSAVLDCNRVCRGICAMDLRSMEVRTFPPTPSSSPPAASAPSSASPPTRSSAPARRSRRSISRVLLRQRRVHPGPPHLHPRRRQAAPDVGIGARRRRPRLGPEDAGRQARSASRFPKTSAGTSSKSGIRSTATSCRATSPPAPSHKVVYEHNLGIDGKPMVYLDLTHIDRKILDRKLEGILEIYEKFVGDDPRDTPMKIFPGMHYTMGGLWVDFNQATNIPGIYAAGECEYQYHGANRLGANSLVSCIFGGFVAGPTAVQLRRKPHGRAEATAAFDAERKRQEENNATPDEVGRHRESVQAVARTGRPDDQELHRHPLQQEPRSRPTPSWCELLERFRHINLSDRTQWANTSGRLRAPALQHAATGAGDRPGRAPARRIARRTLQAGLPRARRQELAEDDEGDFRAGCRRAEV